MGDFATSPALLVSQPGLGPATAEFRGFPFNPLLRSDDYLYIEQAAKEAFGSIEDERLKGSYHPLDELKEETKKDSFSSMKFTFIIWVNGEDNLRFISMQKDGNIKEAFQRLTDGVKVCGKIPTIILHYGWLTFDPRNLGSTVRASAFVKLPQLSSRSDFKKVCEEHNIDVCKMDGSVCHVSNHQVLGVTEFEAVKQLYDGLKVLLEIEKSKP
ncbi:unnamed protein product [Soboliphyme baturini]|uniref:arginine kinase n=1 Tax=Soboliphyme baturini TaxID=241478 RepID=A0A183IZN2_9BILA|nr:unnamed protein product [Soboliphyme baturini]